MATSPRHPGDIMDSTSMRRVAEGSTLHHAASTTASITTTSSSGPLQTANFASWPQIDHHGGPVQQHNWQHEFASMSSATQRVASSANYEGMGQAWLYAGQPAYNQQHPDLSFHEQVGGELGFTTDYQIQGRSPTTTSPNSSSNEALLSHGLHNQDNYDHHCAGSGGRLKPHSTPMTLNWLEKNYELSEGVCIPRNVVYYNYVDFCSKNMMQPVNAASFGKIIRQMFQSLTTRRLGTRGQSRYHYYGLAVKAESIYFSPSYSNRKFPRLERSQWTPPSMNAASVSPARMEITNNSELGSAAGSSYILPTQVARTEAESHPFAGQKYVQMTSHASGGNGGGGVASCLSTKAFPAAGFASVQQLPDFPSFFDFRPYLDANITEDRFQSLFTMYRAHSQRIMDSVNKFSFVEIPSLFKHFWQETPNHILCFIGQKSIVTFIGVCDHILYSTILKAILPSPIQVLPEDIIKIVRKFAGDMVVSLQHSLRRMPSQLVQVKMRLVKQLSQCLKRRTAVNHLYQAANMVISPSSQPTYEDLLKEWRLCNWDHITKNRAPGEICSPKELVKVGATFQNLLEDKSSVGDMCWWVLGIIKAKIRNQIPADWISFNKSSQEIVDPCEQFVGTWLAISDKLFPDQLYPSSPLHLLKVLFHELIIHEIEMIILDNTSQELMRAMLHGEPKSKSFTNFLHFLGTDFLTKHRPAAEASDVCNQDSSEDFAPRLPSVVNVKQENPSHDSEALLHHHASANVAGYYPPGPPPAKMSKKDVPNKAKGKEFLGSPE